MLILWCVSAERETPKSELCPTIVLAAAIKSAVVLVKSEFLVLTEKVSVRPTSRFTGAKNKTSTLSSAHEMEVLKLGSKSY